MVITSSTRNRVGGNTPRGFESHLLRQNKDHPSGWSLFFTPKVGFERRLLAACRNRRGFSTEKGSHPLRQLVANYAGSRRLFYAAHEKVISYLLRCSSLQNRDRFAGSRFCFCGRDRPRCSRKKPIRMDGLFGAAARVGEDGAEIRRRSVYTDAASWSRKSWMTSNRWTGSSCWVVQSFARRSTAARSSEKGEMTASVVQQPLCRCWPRRP